ncbi:MAG: hypothetical protein HC849_26640 [Oscillatoriales cyanobacterium RU_3_3]|nr:hypothetical protein [Oscillatoriales cyanobacterium RU_3_3]NJR24941.1 hypothetical protein [Richelia sp. CSU_2_1]
MTATTDRPLKHFCIEDLKSADLTGISLIPQPLTLRLDFTLTPEFMTLRSNSINWFITQSLNLLTPTQKILVSGWVTQN